MKPHLSQFAAAIFISIFYLSIPNAHAVVPEWGSKTKERVNPNSGTCAILNEEDRVICSATLVRESQLITSNLCLGKEEPVKATSWKIRCPINLQTSETSWVFSAAVTGDGSSGQKALSLTVTQPFKKNIPYLVAGANSKPEPNSCIISGWGASSVVLQKSGASAYFKQGKCGGSDCAPSTYKEGDRYYLNTIPTFLADEKYKYSYPEYFGFKKDEQTVNFQIKTLYGYEFKFGSEGSLNSSPVNWNQDGTDVMVSRIPTEPNRSPAKIKKLTPIAYDALIKKEIEAKFYNERVPPAAFGDRGGPILCKLKDSKTSGLYVFGIVGDPKNDSGFYQSNGESSVIPSFAFSSEMGFPDTSEDQAVYSEGR